jgi:membrane protein required for colicin V production
MNTFDILISALLIFGFIRGLTKGLFVEVASLVALIAGIYGAIHFSYFVGTFLTNRVSWEERYITIVSFAITFAIIVFVIGLLGKLFTKIADFASLGLINKLLGGAFGALKIGLILSIVLLVFTKLNSTIPFISEEQKAASVLYEPVKDLAPSLFPNFLTIVENQAELKVSE